MSPHFASLLARAHGHLGWLAVAALAHPAWLLGKPGRPARTSVLASATLVVVVAVLGGVIYSPYRERVRTPLFIEHPDLGWMFERKEHLAVGATCLAVTGAIAHLLASARPPTTLGANLEPVARRAFRAAFMLALVAALLGTYVSSVRPL